MPVAKPLGGMSGCRASVKGEEKDTRGGNESIFVPPFVKGLTIRSRVYGLSNRLTEERTNIDISLYTIPLLPASQGILLSVKGYKSWMGI